MAKTIPDLEALATLIPDDNQIEIWDPAEKVSKRISIADLVDQLAMKIIDSDGDEAQVIAGANTGVKGLRVYGGPVDPISDLPVHIDFDHHQSHEGETWRWSVLVPAAANTNTKSILLTVPNINLSGSTAVVRCPHMRFEVVADASGDVLLSEGPFTNVTGGTSRTPIAVERNGSYTPKLTIHEDPTITTLGGTPIWRGLITGSKTTAGGTDTSANEFILRNNTAYMLQFTPAANNTKYLIRIVWYEDLGV